MKSYKGVAIKQRIDGRWYGRIKLRASEYKDVYGKTQRECYTKVKKIMDKPKLIMSMAKERAEKKKEKQLKLEHKEMPKHTVGTWYEYWINTYKKPICKPSTLRNAEYIRRNYLAQIRSQPLADLTAASIQEFLATIKSDCMRRRTYIILGDMLRKAVLLNMIEKNPINAVIAPKYRAQERCALEPEEQQLFINAASGSEYWPIYAIMLFEGLRTGEAKALRHCDIKQDCIVVSGSLNDFGEITSTKTGGVRKIPIFAPFRPIADKLRSKSTAPIFAGANKHTANDEYREIMRGIGLDYNLYALRHTFATNCARAGVVAKQVSIWMGHTDVSMTLRYYTNISSSFEQKNVSIVDTIFDTDSPGK